MMMSRTIFPFTVTIQGTEYYLFAMMVDMFLFLPTFAVSVRRLHDIGKSGWFCLVSCIPVIGNLITFIWNISDSEPRFNKYGPDPKAFTPVMQF